MTLALTFKRRLLLTHLSAALLAVGVFGAWLYFAASTLLIDASGERLVDQAALLAERVDLATIETAAHAPPPSAALRDALVRAMRDGPNANAFVVMRGDPSLRLLASIDTMPPRALVPDAVDDATPVAAGFEAPVALRVENGRWHVPTIAALAPVPRSDGRYAVGLEIGPAQLAESFAPLRLSALAALLVALLAAVVLSRMQAERLQNALRDLMERCRLHAAGETPPALGEGGDEFAELAREFDRLAKRLRVASHGRERAFAALREANRTLEDRVRHRTGELEAVTYKLRDEIEGRVHVEALLAEAAMTDPLTGLLNRRAMVEMLKQICSDLKPGDQGFSLVLADIDHFKRVNDTHGHAVGDHALASIAAAMRRRLGDERQAAARWGGEEFLMLLPATRLAAACKIAEDVRSTIGALAIGERALSLTLSLGVAEHVPGQPLDDCLRRADQALYKAKASGRNTVVAARGQMFATMS